VVWSCYEERKFGSGKNGYRICAWKEDENDDQRRRWLNVMECGYGTIGVCVCVCVNDVDEREVEWSPTPNSRENKTKKSVSK